MYFSIHYTDFFVKYWRFTGQLKLSFLELLAMQQLSDVVIRPAESKQRTTEDVKGTEIGESGGITAGNVISRYNFKLVVRST